MKILYMGTADFAVNALISLHQFGHEICTVVTQPDKPNSRRGNEVVFSPVKKAAIELNIPIYQPKNISTEESEKYLQSFQAEVMIVCAYGQLLKKNILNLTPYGCINIHASLLPKYRGAAPIHRCIIDGQTRTGISIMYMNEGLDSGDVMIQQQIDIPKQMTVGQLHDLMKIESGGLIIQAMQLLQNGQAPRIAQNDCESTYAEKISKADCKIEFNDDSNKIYDRIRGLNPFPAAFTLFNGKIIKLYDIENSDQCYNKSAGSIAGYQDDGIIIVCKSGSILIKTLKPEGKRLMTASEFWAGLHQKENLFFGN